MRDSEIIDKTSIISVAACSLIEFPRIVDSRGDLSFIENNKHIPFEIKRAYYLYNVPVSAVRGGHAHKQLQQVLIALSGSFEVHLDDGHVKNIVTLNKPWEGLLIGNKVWRELKEFSGGSTCLVLASRVYEETDYYHDYEEFLVSSRTPAR